MSDGIKMSQLLHVRQDDVDDDDDEMSEKT